jgi:hypothetical protein
MKFRTIAFAAALLATQAAQAALVPTIEDATPILLDPSKAAFYVTETPTSTGGRYTIHNNTTNLSLVGFGVTNPDMDSLPGIETAFGFSPGFGPVYYSDIPDRGEFWRGFNLNGSNWSDAELYDDYYANLSTPQALFGDIGPALEGEGNSNYYQIEDARALPPGESASGFAFEFALPASSAFGVAADLNGAIPSNDTFAFINAPVTVVPLPAAGWMMLAGIGALVGFARRKA